MIERVDTGVRIDNRFEKNRRVTLQHDNLVHPTLQRQIHFRFRSQLNFDHQKKLFLDWH